mmetsp:Transcript_13331/g.18341  ORF Transcript_13331/g.18341 Transcript_13331/m.18341 type:complete len:252 (-) Transcript_13331:45-800(-)
MKTSFIRLVSSLASAESCVSSTSFTTLCQELSFSRSASRASNLSCSSERFRAILASRRASRSAWNFSKSTRACSTSLAFAAFSSSLRCIRVTCHSLFHLAIGESSGSASTSSSGSSSPTSSRRTAPVSPSGTPANPMSPVSSGAPIKITGSSPVGAAASTSPMNSAPSSGAGGIIIIGSSPISAWVSPGGLKNSPVCSSAMVKGAGGVRVFVGNRFAQVYRLRNVAYKPNYQCARYEIFSVRRIRRNLMEL